MQFLPFVQHSCMVFPNAPREAPYMSVQATNLVDFNLTYGLEERLLVPIPLTPKAIPDHIIVQDPSSAEFRDKLVGVALDGVPIYSGLSAVGADALRSTDESNNLQVDGCGGSYGPTPTGWRYHYRIMPSCLGLGIRESSIRRLSFVDDVLDLLDSFEGRAPSILGYSLAGYPIYSPLDVAGTPHASLDNCNGRFIDGAYAYFATPQFPYLVGCDGPGVYSTASLGVTEEALPTISGIHFKQCPGGSYPSTDFVSNGCVLCPAGTFSIAG